MSLLSSYYLDYSRHVARLLRRRRRRARPLAIPLAMITMRKLTLGFPFASHMGMGLRSSGPSGRLSSAITVDTTSLHQHKL